jgi:hypothetical protein
LLDADADRADLELRLIKLLLKTARVCIRLPATAAHGAKRPSGLVQDLYASRERVAPKPISTFISLETGNRPLLLRRLTERGLVDARYLRGDGEVDRGNGKAIAVLVDDDFRFTLELRRHEIHHAKQSDERHGEAGGVSRPKQFLRIGARLFTVAAEEREG